MGPTTSAFSVNALLTNASSLSFGGMARMPPGVQSAVTNSARRSRPTEHQSFAPSAVQVEPWPQLVLHKGSHSFVVISILASRADDPGGGGLKTKSI
jgi:hypothetical protein